MRFGKNNVARRKLFIVHVFWLKRFLLFFSLYGFADFAYSPFDNNVHLCCGGVCAPDVYASVCVRARAYSQRTRVMYLHVIGEVLNMSIL